MGWVAPLVALSAMEIVLGIDNVVFLTVIAERVPEHRRAFARRLGLAMALALRILLLTTLGFVLRFERPLFHLSALGLPEMWTGSESVDAVSAKDLVLLGGGAFLLVKTVLEIGHLVTPGEEAHTLTRKTTSMGGAIVQIAVLDLVFSLDSMLSAIAMTRALWIMIVATSVAVGMMAAFAEPIGRYVQRHPTVKMLALAYLVVIAILLFADGLGTPVPKGYVYFAMGFSFFVELLNERARRIRKGTARPTNPAPYEARVEQT
jgi:predicted tellurium resistance membrane protein TerC